MKHYVTPEIVITKLSFEEIMWISLPMVPVNEGVFSEKNNEDNDIFGAN